MRICDPTLTLRLQSRNPVWRTLLPRGGNMVPFATYHLGLLLLLHGNNGVHCQVDHATNAKRYRQTTHQNIPPLVACIYQALGDNMTIPKKHAVNNMNFDK